MPRRNDATLLLFGALSKEHLYEPQTAYIRKKGRGKTIVCVKCYLHGTVGRWVDLNLSDLEKDESEVARKIVAKIAFDRMTGKG